MALKRATGTGRWFPKSELKEVALLSSEEIVISEEIGTGKFIGDHQSKFTYFLADSDGRLTRSSTRELTGQFSTYRESRG